MKKLYLQVGIGWTCHPNLLLMPKVHRRRLQVHYIGGQAWNRTPRNPQVRV